MIMKPFTFICTVGWIAASVPVVFADIYVWTDSNGVKNFTNYAPPDTAVVFMETPEIEARIPVAETAAEIARIASEPLPSELLRNSQEEIEALTEQVEGLRKELREALEPVPEQPPLDETVVIESTERIGYRTSIGYGYYPVYDPYGYRWYRKFKKHHRPPGYGHGGHKKAIPYKHRVTPYRPSGKKIGQHGVRTGRGHSGFQKSGSIRNRSHAAGSRRHSASRAGHRGGMPSRR